LSPSTQQRPCGMSTVPGAAVAPGPLLLASPGLLLLLLVPLLLLLLLCGCPPCCCCCCPLPSPSSSSVSPSRASNRLMICWCGLSGALRGRAAAGHARWHAAAQGDARRGVRHGRPGCRACCHVGACNAAARPAPCAALRAHQSTTTSPRVKCCSSLMVSFSTST
jgi:hypothetical protein